jgi:hypothetical protein
MEAIVVAPDGVSYIVSAALEVVTPALAEMYLAKMRSNRSVAQRQVGKLTREMEQGRWRPTNQGIGFDAEGWLIDGQHRCHAIKASGCAAVLLVVRGLPPETQNVVDVNRPRQAGDQFNITFQTNDGKQRVAVARKIALLRNGWMFSAESLSNEEQFKLVSDHAREIDWVVTAMGGRRRVAPSSVMAGWAYAYRADPSIAQWAESYVEGAGLDKRDPLLMLREVLASDSPDYKGAELTLKTLRALWAKRRGETMRRLYASAEGVLGFAALIGDDIGQAWSQYRAVYRGE